MPLVDTLNSLGSHIVLPLFEYIVFDHLTLFPFLLFYLYVCISVVFLYQNHPFIQKSRSSAMIPMMLKFSDFWLWNHQSLEYLNEKKNHTGFKICLVDALGTDHLTFREEGEVSYVFPIWARKHFSTINKSQNYFC